MSQIPKKRTRTGCWTCREAGYKCDEIKPSCGRCVRLSLNCKGYGVRIKWKDIRTTTKSQNKKKGRRTSEASPSSSAYSPRMSDIDQVDNSSASPTDKLLSRDLVKLIHPLGLNYNMNLGEYKLLHHFTFFLSPALSVGPRSQINQFQMHLTAMAFDKGPLQSIVFSMALRHLAGLTNQPALETMAQRYQHRAIQILSSVLNDPEESCSDATLAAVLLMQISALFAGDDEPRVDHLVGAKSIILQRGGPSACLESTSRFLLSLFSYHDVLSSISKAQQPLLDYDTLPAVDTDGLMGCTTYILRLVSQISALHSTKNAIKEEQGSWQKSILEVGSAIEEKLKAWEVPPCEPDWNSTAEAYRYSALIYLKRMVYDIGAPHPVTLHYVRQCLDSLSVIPADSPVTSIHVWPLFTAGCEAISPSDRTFAHQRFTDMYGLRKMPSLLRVMRAMEDVWADKDRETLETTEKICTKDCIQIIKRGGKEIDIV